MNIKHYIMDNMQCLAVLSLFDSIRFSGCKYQDMGILAAVIGQFENHNSISRNIKY